MMALRGSCQCGGVKFEITGPLMGVANCHCTRCRKAHSAAFRSRARVQRTDFKWIQGEDLVKYYQSSTDYHRGFCSECGSPVVNWNGPDSTYGKGNPASLTTLGIALGSLDDDPGVRPALHTFVAYKAPWFSITDDLPQCAEYPE